MPFTKHTYPSPMNQTLFLGVALINYRLYATLID